MKLSQFIWDTVHHAADIRADYEAGSIDSAAYHRRLADYSRAQTDALTDHIREAIQ